jgi:ribosomal protein S18 acetylase RimI-like enzyme
MGWEIRKMTEEDVQNTLALTDSEGWGFDEADFVRILELWPGGSFVGEEEGRVVGLVTTASYESTGWIGNVVVEPRSRSSGLGTALVKGAIEHLESRQVASIQLYAYEGLEGFYQPLGFTVLGLYASYRGRIRAARRRYPAERMGMDDLEEVARLDRYSFGDDRLPLLRRILSEFPECCVVLRSQGEIVGYAMAMASERLTNVGPVVSIGPGCERDLLESIAGVLEGRECFLAAPSPSPFTSIYLEIGLEEAFRLKRMLRGEEAPGAPDTILGIGALEKG